MRRASGEWDKVGILLERQANLNQLRVGTIQVYLVVVAAVLALLGGADISTLEKTFVVPLGICLVGVGILVLLYDIKLRARAYAVAVEVAQSVPDTKLESTYAQPFRLDEDLCFSMVLMLINSTLVFIGLELGYFVGEVSVLTATVSAIIVFALQIAFYAWYWPRLARDMSAWPDGFAPQAEDTDGQAE